MLKKVSLISQYLLSLPLVIMLLSCELYAAEVNEQSFQLSISEIQKLRKVDPALALSKVSELAKSLSTYSALQKIQLHQLESKILLDSGEIKQAKIKSQFGLAIANEYQIENAEVAKLFYVQGFANESLGDLNQATIDYANGLEIAQALNDLKLIAYGLTNYGAVYYLTEQYERSMIILTDALKISKELDDPEVKGLVMGELALLYGHLGDYDKSMQHYQGCYEYYKQVNELDSALYCLTNMGVTYIEHEEYIKAIKLFTEAEAQLSAIVSDNIWHIVYVNLAFANIKQKDSDDEAAYQYLQLAEKYLNDIEQHETKLYFLLDKASILRGLKKYQQAFEVLNEVNVLLPKSQSTGLKYLYSSSTAIEMKIYADIGHFEKAYQLQQTYTELSFDNVRDEQLNDINDIRIQYESEQADIENKILAEQQLLQQQKLARLNQQKDKQFTGVIVGLALSVFFAWWLFSLSKSKNKLLKITRTDELTGIANRRHLNDIGFYSFRQAKLHHVGFSILMIDVDHFKQVNDSLGHSTGDAVLKIIAQIGDDIMRGSDTIARVGGEEFICLLTDTTLQQAIIVAERFKNSVEEHKWAVMLEKPLTVSIGIATFDNRLHHSFEDVLKVADKLMYQAKEEGRNKICF